MRGAAFLFLALTLRAASITALAYSPDGATLVSAGYRQVLLWNATTGKPVRRLETFPGAVRALAFSPDGAMLAVAGGMPGQSGAAVLLNVSTGASTPIAQARDELLAVAFSPDGKLLATGGTNNVVEVWNVADQKLVVVLKDHSGWITGIAFSPDGKLLATASADQTVLIWHTDTWKSDFTLPLQTAGPVNGLAFAPEGDILAFAVAGEDEHSIRSWRPQNAFVEANPNNPNQHTQMAQTRPFDTGACVPLAVTFFHAPKPAQGARPHSRILAGCSDHTVRLLGSGGNAIATRTGHMDWVYAVAAAADGVHFASSGGDGTIRIWGAAEKPLFVLQEDTK